MIITTKMEFFSTKICQTKLINHAKLLPALLILFLCSATTTSSSESCFQIPLPGGRKVSFQDGILRIQLDSAKNRPTIIPQPGTQPSQQTITSIVVKDTGTRKGFGAFATNTLDKHTFLGFYEGETINGRNNLECILQNNSRKGYVLSLDGGATFVDGYQRAMDRTVFSPCHLNHEEQGTEACNCKRILLDDGKNVAFFTSRFIEIGEELCFDYGRNYWEGREQDKL